MRNHALLLIPLLLSACDREPIAPRQDAASRLSQDVQSAAADGAIERYTYHVDLPVSGVYSPADYPCLTEPIELGGTMQELVNTFVTPSGVIKFVMHESTGQMNATGQITGTRYAFSGPMTWTFNWSEGGGPMEATFHNLNHFVGPGRDPNLDLRTLQHVRIDPATGVATVEILRSDVICR